MDKCEVELQKRFPITKPQLCNNNPKFPFKDLRHYINPCCDYPENCQIGYTAQETLNQMNNNISKNQSTKHATSQESCETSLKALV